MEELWLVRYCFTRSESHQWEQCEPILPGCRIEIVIAITIQGKAVEPSPNQSDTQSNAAATGASPSVMKREPSPEARVANIDNSTTLGNDYLQ